jgi:peroxiredoxin
MDDRPNATTAVFPQVLDVNPHKSTSMRQLYYLLVLLGASLALNIYLGWNVKALRHLNHTQAQRATPEEGASVPPVRAKDLNDSPRSIIYNESDKPTVLYVFSPACGWCQRNLNNMKTLVELRDRSYEFIGLSLVSEGLQEYMKSNKIGYLVLKEPVSETVERLGLAGTPKTIVISPEGRVLKSWLGAYSGEVKTQVESYFSVQLPGLSPTSNPNGDSAGTCAQCMRDGLAYSVGTVLPATDGGSLRCAENAKWIEIKR